MSEVDWIAELSGASARRGERIQSLWSGYGELFRAELGGTLGVVVKWVRPPAGKVDLGHERKRRSYDVELAWYRELGLRCASSCRVARCFASDKRDDELILVLEDLDAAGFPVRHRSPSFPVLKRCLSWLASFHARFLSVEPTGLWPEGSYWHLATRPNELDTIEDEELRAAAPVLDDKLRAATFRTLVHGDAKLANFCFAPDAEGVAAVDFQYVGGGCGMRDVAYLLAGDAGSHAAELSLLDWYFEELRAAAVGVNMDALEREWRQLYPIACADFYRFLAGWAPEYWRKHAVGKRTVEQVMRELAGGR